MVKIVPVLIRTKRVDTLPSSNLGILSETNGLETKANAAHSLEPGFMKYGDRLMESASIFIINSTFLCHDKGNPTTN